jgi:hypothetical protein
MVVAVAAEDEVVAAEAVDRVPAVETEDGIGKIGDAVGCIDQFRHCPCR